MTPPRVCVDASLALALVLPGQAGRVVERLWAGWQDQGIQVVVPPLFFAEVTSVLRESVYFGRMTPEQGDVAFSSLLNLPFILASPAELQLRAWALAKRYNRPRAYDAQYLAVASLLGCELWTVDRRLANAVPVPWLKCVT